MASDSHKDYGRKNELIGRSSSVSIFILGVSFIYRRKSDRCKWYFMACGDQFVKLILSIMALQIHVLHRNEILLQAFYFNILKEIQ